MSEKEITIMKIMVNKDQEAAIRILFSLNSWNLLLEEDSVDTLPYIGGHTIMKDLVDLPQPKLKLKAQSKGRQSCRQRTKTNNGQISDQHPSSVLLPTGNHSQRENPQVMPAVETSGNQCPFCFLCPCLVTYPPSWVGKGQQPRPGNNLIRKDLYKRFWKTMDHMGAWTIPQYIAKRDSSRANAHRVEISREIMPECILELVRRLYPNQSGKPYMGHKWCSTLTVHIECHLFILQFTLQFGNADVV